MYTGLAKFLNFVPKNEREKNGGSFGKELMAQRLRNTVLRIKNKLYVLKTEKGMVKCKNLIIFTKLVKNTHFFAINHKGICHF